MSDRPATKGRRLLRLAGMTAQVATDYARARVKSVFQSREQAEEDLNAAHLRSGEIIARTLGELKGAVMKVGQIASVAADALPKPVADALASLQREAPPMPFEVIAEQIEHELGRPPEALFERFERIPFASASIGQVHRARTDDGREVVVKVQYPGVDEAVDSDLAHLKLALRVSGLVKIKRAALDAVFAEVRTRLVEELDYCNEADNVRLFRGFYRDRPGIVVPEVIGERSSQRVLTLTYEPGDHVSEARGYPQEVRNRIGQALFELIAEQVFALQVIHADPNPANFAFRPDGTVILYDFGCIKRLDPEVVAAYRDTVRAGLAGDYTALEAGLVRLGARDLDGPPVPSSYYARWREVIARPFLEQPFDYSQASIQRDSLKLVPEYFTKYTGSFQPPSELVFLDRVVIGQYGLLRELGVRGSFRPLLESQLAA